MADVFSGVKEVTSLSRVNGKEAVTTQKISRENRLIQIYVLLLKSCLRFPARTIIGAVVVKGRDFDRMRNVAEDIQYYLENLSSIQTLGFNISDNRPEIHLTFDSQLLSQLGISLNAIAGELNNFQNA